MRRWAIVFPIDLEWGEIENYGTDIEVANYLVSRDGTCDYGKINDSAEIEVYKVPGKGDLIRTHQGGKKRTSNQFRDKSHWGKPKNRFRATQSNFGKLNDRKPNPAGIQARVAKVEGLHLNGGFEQRDRVGINLGITRLVLSAEIRIALMLNVLFG